MVCREYYFLGGFFFDCCVVKIVVGRYFRGSFSVSCFKRVEVGGKIYFHFRFRFVVWVFRGIELVGRKRRYG